MARRARWLALAVLLGVPAMTVLPAVAGGAAACAAALDESPHAGLVVDTGGGATTYCVGLDGATVSGIHLIELAAAQYGLQYRLGFGGKAVCQLQGVGPDGDDCFAQYPDFWGYWHHTGDEGWTWANAGAATAVIADGDLDGWTWGSGDTGATHPAPPALRFDEVCRPEPSPTPDPEPSPTPAPTPRPTHPPSSAPPTEGGSGPTGGSGSGTGTNPSPTDRPTTTSPSPTASESMAATASGSATPTLPVATTPPASVVAATAASPGGGGGSPPVGVLIAVGAVLVFAVGGAVRLRADRIARRTPRDP
jgi:hypothetical protein